MTVSRHNMNVHISWVGGAKDFVLSWVLCYFSKICGTAWLSPNDESSLETPNDGNEPIGMYILILLMLQNSDTHWQQWLKYFILAVWIYSVRATKKFPFWKIHHSNNHTKLTCWVSTTARVFRNCITKSIWSNRNITLRRKIHCVNSSWRHNCIIITCKTENPKYLAQYWSHYRFSWMFPQLQQ